MTSVHALVSPEFFDALTSHAKVKEAYDKKDEAKNESERTENTAETEKAE